MAEFDRIVWNVKDGVGHLTLNRPERLNAIDTEMIAQLDMVLREAWSSAAVRAVLVTGAGRGFSAGADVKNWAETAEQVERGDADEDSWPLLMHGLITRLYRLPKPVVAAVNGVAVGAGCDLTLACDFRIASDRARFGEAYIRLGYCPDAGGSYLLPRIIGPTRAAEMIYTGRIVEADEALQIGLVSEVVPHDDLLERAGEWAERLASGPTVAIGLAKENLRVNQVLTFEEALRNERRTGELCGHTDDHREGLAAINAKREPVFQGR
jgi:enoyl-CoA hydratase/carnithine racemase